MKLLEKILILLDDILLQEAARSISRIKLDPPDLIVYFNHNLVVLNRFLVCRDIELEADFDEKNAWSLLESYKALLKSLPGNTYIYIQKENIDTTSLLKKITNEILNIQAELESSRDEAKRVKTNLKLEKLRRLYTEIASGKPFVKTVLVLVVRIEANNLESAKSMAEYYESLITSTFRDTYGLKLEKAGRSEITRFLLGLLGLLDKPVVKPIEVPLSKLSILQPLLVDKPPKLDKTILIGFQLDTNHPVEIPVSELYKHLVVIGPTGKGKTTLIASIIKQLVSEDLMKIVAFDFKGDLSRYLPPELVEITTPDKTPINVLNKPPSIDSVDWKILVTEALSLAAGLNEETVLKALNEIEENNQVLTTVTVSVLGPFRELFTDSSGSIIELLQKGRVVFNVEGRGIAFQNAYVAICIGILRHLLKNNFDANTVVFVDDAWRIIELRTLRELVREGRSRKIGVVVSTQSPMDIPQDILENIHTAIVFGSRNREYILRVIEAFNIPRETSNLIPKLGVGEGVYINASTKEVKPVKILDLKINNRQT